MQDEASFWTSFWPNVASTTIGVILGVPIALLLNRWTQILKEKAQKKSESIQLFHGLETIERACLHNKDILKWLSRNLNANQAPFEIRLDTFAWEAARDQIVPFLKNSDLQRLIAFHFGQLASLCRLLEIYLDMVVGIKSALSRGQAHQEVLKNYLIQKTGQLHDEAGTLVSNLAKARSKNINALK